MNNILSEEISGDKNKGFYCNSMLGRQLQSYFREIGYYQLPDSRLKNARYAIASGSKYQLDKVCTRPTSQYSSGFDSQAQSSVKNVVMPPEIAACVKEFKSSKKGSNLTLRSMIPGKMSKLPQSTIYKF